jgi:hypothetical protein
MQLPGFLTRDPSERAELPEDGASRGCATHGFLIGCFTALCLWFVPIPVVIIVWVFDLKAPFGDYMLMAAPILLSLPIIGAAFAGLSGRRRTSAGVRPSANPEQ